MFQRALQVSSRFVEMTERRVELCISSQGVWITFDELPFGNRIQLVETGKRSTRHCDGDCSVDIDDGRGYEASKLIVERRYLGLQMKARKLTTFRRSTESGEAFFDEPAIPPCSILFLQQEQTAVVGGARF